MARILVVFYSTYGHVYAMARAAAEGCAEADGAEAVVRRVTETLSEDVLRKMGAIEAQKAFAEVPVVTLEDVESADGILFGSPTRFGNMAAQMKSFIDSMGQLWMKGALVGKPGGVFTSSATQHGGQESTILAFHTVLLHHGMVIAGLPYTWQGQMRTDEITGCSPYGASTVAGGKGERMPSENELEGARFQGRHLAEIAVRLAG